MECLVGSTTSGKKVKTSFHSQTAVVNHQFGEKGDDNKCTCSAAGYKEGGTNNSPVSNSDFPNVDYFRYIPSLNVD